MQSIKRILFALLFILNTPAIAGTVVLDDDFSSTSLETQVDLLEDASGELPFEQAVDGSFAPSNASFLYLGYTKSAYWLRFNVENRTSGHVDAVLAISYSFLDRIELYEPDFNGGYKQRIAGESISKKEDDGSLHPAFRITIPKNVSVSYYLRIETVDSMMIPISLWERDAYEQFDRILWLFFGVSFGALISVIFYNLFLYLTTKEPSSGYYALYISAFLLVVMDYDGFFTVYLWPGSMWWADRFHVLTAGTMAIFSLLFIQTFLATRKNLPRIHRILNFYLAFCVAFMIGSLLWPDFADIMRGLISSSLFYPTLAIIAGVARFRQGDRTARFFLLAWVFGALSVMIYLSMHHGLLPSSYFWVIHAMDLGVMVESILFSLAIADKMDQHRRDKEQVEREAKEKLAVKVDERTAELNAAVQHAEYLANTDMLTQLNNRRAFYSLGEKLMQTVERTSSVIMLDIDNFKKINDGYGHASGDQAIKKVAKELLMEIGESDIVGRIGGEEFAVLLPDTTAFDASRLAERIREKIANTTMEARGGLITFTASFGVAEGSKEQRLDDLVAAADSALYKAKQGGRNQTIISGNEETDFDELYTEEVLDAKGVL